MDDDCRRPRCGCSLKLDRIERLSGLIITFMTSDRAAGVKMTLDESAMTLHDDDSNWGFDPRELAALIVDTEK